MEAVAPQFQAFAHVAHVNLKERKAFCFMCGPDEESIREAHEAVHLTYDSIMEVKRVTGADMRASRHDLMTVSGHKNAVDPAKGMLYG